MTSPARRHYLRSVAAQAAAAGANSDEMPTATANAYELMLRRLAEHRRQLKMIQSIDRKVEAKRAYLPDYTDWVAGVLAADRGGQDDVLVTVLVWLIDTGDLAAALPLADYAIRHGLTMPDHYQRGIACVVAEEFAEAALKQLQAGEVPDVEALQRAKEITAEHDMPDEARAKLFKALGYALRAQCEGDTAGIGLGQMEVAIDYLKQALQLHDKVGVKKDIERLEREIKKATEQQNPAPAGNPAGQG